MLRTRQQSVSVFPKNHIHLKTQFEAYQEPNAILALCKSWWEAEASQIKKK